MTSLLVSSDPRAPGQYHLGGKIGAIGLVELLAGQRVYPPERAGPVLVKHAPRTHPSFAGIRERLVDEVQGHAVYVHPNLTALTDVVEDERGLFVVFEYPFGADLAAINGVLRPRAQPLPFELAAYVARELSRGAQHLHDARGPRGEPQPISLRDVTPTQVLVTARGEVKLANRGLASILAELRRLPAPEQVAYYAPERIAGEPFGVRTDLFAIGVMLFELLVGRPCFSGATQEAVLTQIVSSAVPASLLPTVGVPAPLAAIVERATAFVPERRYASAAEMARDLDAWLAQVGARDVPGALARFLVAAGLVAPVGTTPAAIVPATGHAPAQAVTVAPPSGPQEQEVHVVLPPSPEATDDDEDARPLTKAERRKQQVEWVRETAVLVVVALALIAGLLILTAFERDFGQQLADEVGETWIQE